jgi:hypothetical protein
MQEATHYQGISMVLLLLRNLRPLSGKGSPTLWLISEASSTEKSTLPRQKAPWERLKICEHPKIEHFSKARTKRLTTAPQIVHNGDEMSIYYQA